VLAIISAASCKDTKKETASEKVSEEKTEF